LPRIYRRCLVAASALTVAGLIPFGFVAANAESAGFTAVVTATAVGQAAEKFPVAATSATPVVAAPVTAGAATQPPLVEPPKADPAVEAAKTPTPTPTRSKEPKAEPSKTKTADPEPAGTTTTAPTGEPTEGP
jgi:hypothetical protein